MREASPVVRPPLRIGLILDKAGQPPFVAAIVSRLRESGWGRIELVLRDESDAPRASWFFRLYSRIDRPIVEHDASRVDAEVLSGIPAISTRNTESALKQARVDLVLDLRSDGRSDIRRDALRSNPSCGVWWLFRGDRPPAGFWEVATASPVTKVELRAIRVGEESDRMIGEILTATKPGLSWRGNRLTADRAIAPLIVERVRELGHVGCDAGVLRFPKAPAAVARTDGPTSLEVAGWLLPAVVTKGWRRLVRREMAEIWQLGIRDSGTPLLARNEGNRAAGFTWLPAPAGRHFADPFLIEHGGGLWCFFEDIDASTGRGRIAAAPVLPGPSMGTPTTVLERSYHLSYPCVFRHRGDLFMIPESSENGTVELYRCAKFPGEWSLERVLLNETAVDTAICMQGQRMWLFTTLLDPQSLVTRLALFWSESLDGRWTPHRGNPVCLDVRFARGAGAIFVQDGRLIRPSQDCSARYGWKFTLNEIVTLTPDRYDERPLVTVEPMPGFVGTHSYARCGSVEMIDASRLVPADRLPLAVPGR